MIGRRNSTLGCAALLVAPRLATAQAGRQPKLAVVNASLPVAQMKATDRTPFYATFFPELRRLGYVEGTNLIVTRWSAEGNVTRYSSLARDVVASQPDVIFAVDVNIGEALRIWTTEIPIVLAGSLLAGRSFIRSLSRPGGNVTGISFEDFSEVVAKQIELLHELVPEATSAAYLGPPINFAGSILGQAWRRRGLTYVDMTLDEPAGPAEYRRVFAKGNTNGVKLLVVAQYGANYVHEALIVELATEYRLPAAFSQRSAVAIGGLMSYSVDRAEWGRLSAGYVARILKGDRPAELPVHVIDKFEFVINRTTARTLGLTIPPAILARADEVIE